MFYSADILTSRSQKGFGLYWLAATLGPKSGLKKFTKRELMGCKVPTACDRLASPEEPLSLRLSSSLMMGIARIYSQQYSIFYSDVNNLVGTLKKVVNDMYTTSLHPSTTGVDMAPVGRGGVLAPGEGLTIDFSVYGYGFGGGEGIGLPYDSYDAWYRLEKELGLIEDKAGGGEGGARGSKAWEAGDEDSQMFDTSQRFASQASQRSKGKGRAKELSLDEEEAIQERRKKERSKSGDRTDLIDEIGGYGEFADSSLGMEIGGIGDFGLGIEGLGFEADHQSGWGDQGLLQGVSAELDAALRTGQPPFGDELPFFDAEGGLATSSGGQGDGSFGVGFGETMLGIEGSGAPTEGGMLEDPEARMRREHDEAKKVKDGRAGTRAKRKKAALEDEEDDDEEDEEDIFSRHTDLGLGPPPSALAGQPTKSALKKASPRDTETQEEDKADYSPEAKDVILKKKPEPKKKKVRIDESTSLTNIDLKQHRNEYPETMKRLNEENRERDAEKDAARRANEMLTGVPGIFAGSHANFWSERLNFRAKARQKAMARGRGGKNGHVKNHDLEEEEQDQQQARDNLAPAQDDFGVWGGPLEQPFGMEGDFGRAPSEQLQPEVPRAPSGKSETPSVGRRESGSRPFSQSPMPWNQPAGDDWGFEAGPASSQGGTGTVDRFSADTPIALRSGGKQPRASSLHPSLARSLHSLSPAGRLSQEEAGLDGEGFEMEGLKTPEPEVEGPSQGAMRQTLEKDSLNFLEYARRQKASAETDNFFFGDLVPTLTSPKAVAATGFYHLLVLVSKDMIKVEQDEPFGEISLEFP